MIHLAERFAMARKMVGVGSQYLLAYRDSNNDFLMGDLITN